MSGGVLKITDGITTIDLLNNGAGITLTAWTPARPAKRRVKTSGPFGGGARVRMYAHETVVDGLTFIIHHDTPNLLIRECQELDRLLLKALDAWASGWSVNPVWLEARGEYETNARYAVITDYEGFADSNPYSEPFTHAGNASVGEVTLAIEHLPWTDVQPHALYTYGHGVELETLQTYQIQQGREAAGTVVVDSLPVDEHYVCNLDRVANITHIFSWNAGGFSLNRLAGALPYDLYLMPVANGDRLYFGCDTALFDSGPFNSLVFNLSVAATYGVGCSGAWRYWDGGAWSPLAVQDNTDATALAPFSASGCHSVHWQQPADWATVAVNGVTGYWVRLVLTVGAGAITTPTQATRHVYSIAWPSVKIPASQVPGDMPALAQIKVHCQSESSTGAPWTTGYINRVLVGGRSLSRGTVYTPFLNWSDEQNPGNVTVASAGVSAFAANATLPTGRALVTSFGAASGYALQGSIQIGGLGIGTTTPGEWDGDYHCYMRYVGSGAGANGQMNAYVRFVSGVTGSQMIYSTPAQPMRIATTVNILDLGTVHLPVGIPRSATNRTYQLMMELWVNNLIAAARTATWVDLILFPVDEWFGLFEENITAASTTGLPLTTLDYLDISSLSFYQEDITSIVRFDDNSAIGPQPISTFVPYTPQPMTLQCNKEQRLWFLFFQSPALTGLPRTSPPHLAASIRILRMSRYQSMRGDR